MSNIINKYEDESAFYDKLSGIIITNSKHREKMYSYEKTIDDNLLTELTKFFRDTYFIELGLNGYDYLKSGIIIENAILKCSFIDENSQIILSNFIYNISFYLKEISESEIIKNENKITEKAFFECLNKELDSIFRNPVKTIEFLISPPINLAWISGTCVYETWNA